MVLDQTQIKSPEFPISTVLRDGSVVLVRPLGPDDKPLLNLGLQQLSEQDRYFRFLQPMPRLPEKMLRKFTEIDHLSHEAFGALDISNNPGAPAGVARYVRAEHDSEVAEIAITIVDRHKGNGLGAILFDLLMERARRNQINWFEAIVSVDNDRMLGFLKKFDPVLITREHDVFRVRVSTESTSNRTLDTVTTLPKNWMPN